jgi:hypothetical protein
MAKLNKRNVDNLGETDGQEKVVWDDDLPGFGVRVKARWRKVLSYSVPQRPRT